MSAGTGYFASTPLTEETEAAGLTRLSMPRPLEAETGKSYSIDVTRVVGLVSLTGDAVRIVGRVIAIEVERESRYEIYNADRPATNIGVELLATMRKAPFALTGTYAFVRSREQDGEPACSKSPLTPKHSLGLVGMWETRRRRARRHRVLLHRRAAARSESVSIAFESVFDSRTAGRAQVRPLKVFLNAENLTNVRQTKFDPLVLPAQAIDGRWTVDAWAPLDGRTFNAGSGVL